MPSLPQFQSDDQSFNLLNNRWGSILNPVIANPLVNGTLLEGIRLTSGDNTINHRLQRKLIGWLVVGINAAASLYDKQSTNTTPQTTLVINSNATATVNIYVF